MKKYDALKKKIIKDAVVAGAIIAGSLVFMMAISGVAESALQDRASSESSLGAAHGQLSSLKMQIEKSGSAEKRYAGIQIERTQENYTADTEAFKEQIRVLKEKYRLTDTLKLSLAPENKSTRPDFATGNYDVMQRDDTQLTFGAMSDVHVFSFIDEFMRSAPGIVRLTKLTLTRKMVMDSAAFTQMASGSVPEVVGVEMHFLWAGLVPKEKPKVPPAPGGAP
jgi:hypothetical protein